MSFKLNSNKKVFNENIDLIRPEIGKENWLPRSISFTQSDLNKLEKLRAKYKISKSAILRILLQGVE